MTPEVVLMVNIPRQSKTQRPVKVNNNSWWCDKFIDSRMQEHEINAV